MAGKINVGLTVALQGLAQTQKQLNALGQSINSIGKTAGLAAIGYGVFVTAVKASDFAMSAIEGAKSLERNLLGLKSVFEDVTPQMRAFSVAAEQVGLSQTEAAKASTFIGSVLKQSGFSIQETADLTERLVRLGTDLSLTYGYDVQEALMGMTALFRGEYDPIEKFGVAMKQSEINSELAARKLDHLTGAARRFAEQQIRVELLFQRSADAQGAFERGAGTLAVEQLKLQAAFNNLRDTVANNLLPVLAKATMSLGEGLTEAEPKIRAAFVALEPIIGRLAETVIPKILDAGLVVIDTFTEVLNLLGRILDPTTEVGDAFKTLGQELAGLLGTIFDEDFTDANVFEIIEATVRETAQVVSTLVNELDNLLISLKAIAQAVNIDELFKPDTFANLIVNIGLAVAGFKLLRSVITPLSSGMANLAGRFTTASNGVVTLTATLTTLSLLIRSNPFLLLITGLSVAGIALQDYANQLYDTKVNTQGLDEEQIKQQERLKALQKQLGQYQYALKYATEGNKELIEDGIKKTQDEIAILEIKIRGAIGEVNRFNNLKLDKIRNQFALLNGDFGDTGERNRFLNAQKGFFAKYNPLLGTEDDQEETKEKARNFIKEFYDQLKEDVQKQIARKQLELKGASDGLIDAILGSEGWMKIWLQIKQGKIVLDDLQREFNQTTAGAKEAAKALQDIADYKKKVEDIKLNLEKELKAIAKEAELAKRNFADLFNAFSILPTIQREIGQFEAQATDLLASIESSLRSAFDNEDIYEDGYKALKDFAQQELRLLIEIGRQRDELAQRFDLAKGLIDNYKRAFTAALDLTQLFGQLKEETETRTVTSVSKALMRLGGSMREFEVTISSSYEETIGGIQNRTQGILTGFREMAEKARAFGENLRKLRALGLHGELFQQLIDAGIDAGGATAQALVEGGSDTINELNNLYKEIEAVGADLGEDVASELYGTGIDMANGLLEGIRSKQAELENQARTMAQAFNAAFQAALNIQVDRVAADRATAATEAAAKAIAEIPVPEGLEKELPIDQAALGRIRDLIEGADRYIRNISDATKRAGAIVKRDIFRSLEADILAGRAINLSGISSGMTSGELAQAAIAAGGTTVNNYYTIEVAADTRASGSKAGEVIVEALQQFNLRNGAFNVAVAV